MQDRQIPLVKLPPDERDEVWQAKGQEQAAKEMQEQAVSPADEHYWPKIRPHILRRQEGDSNDQVPIKVSCVICLESLSIANLSGSKSDINNEDARPNNAHQRCKIAPCGHVFCEHCLKQALKAQNSTGVRSCPTCRLQLSCRECGKLSNLASVPRSREACSGPARGATDCPPPTIPEGGNYEPLCGRCSARDLWRARVRRGEWPESALQIEVGFVDFVYHVLDKLEGAKKSTTTEAVMSVFEAVMNDEFDFLVKERENYIKKVIEKRRVGENPEGRDGFYWL